MKLRITIEIELESAMCMDDLDERIWAENEILIGDGSLILHSNEIGDSVGVVKKVSNIVWIDK